MNKCGLVIVDTGPLKTLAYAESLELLLKVNIPIFISDMVICELENAIRYRGNAQVLTFIKKYLGTQIKEIKTGVPEIAEELKKLKVDPGDESIRRIINKYEDELEGEYALLISEDDKFMRTADPIGHTYMMTTRPFLKELENRHIINDAEKLMIKAEKNSIFYGEPPGRGQLKRKREWNNTPLANPSIKPF